MFKNRKLIAILRGIHEDEAVDIAKIILENGIDWLEVTSNSPNYIQSITKIIKAFPTAMIGAGTITTEQQVIDCYDVGAKFIVSPNCNPAVIAETKNKNMISMPGVLTPSEALSALLAGADFLKVFPVSWIGFSAIKDLRAVLPPETKVLAVGGVKISHYDEVLSPDQAGFDGIGIGSDLYAKGDSLEQLENKAKLIVSTYDNVVKI